MQASSLRKGMAVKYQKQLCIVTEFAHRTPGNLRAFVQVTLKNYVSGQQIQARFSSTEDIEIAVLEGKKVQFLYHDGDGYHFMDLGDYQQYAVQPDVLGDSKFYLTESMELELMFYENKPIQANLPSQVTLKVVDSPPGIRGDSVSNNTKPAVLETGLKVNIPMFIEEGTLIKVNTRSGEYVGRAETK